MNYPLISEYIEAIKAAEDNFDQLKHLRPVLGEDGEPVMTSGNFAVVFKMKDEQTGKLHAVKCFLKEQEGRAEAYRQIAEELEFVSSTFLTPIKYLDKELFVDSSNSEDSEFPVLLMDWVEGQTLDKYIREHIDDQYELSLLAYQFSCLAMWLMPQPFAHGDLKPDNILVKEDGTLVLVDYDGMYVPAMKGQKARELGSPDFRHPGRTEEVFDDHIDDFSLASILLSLKAIALQPDLLEKYGTSDRLLFSEKDYRNLSESSALGALQPLMQDAELASLYSLYILALSQNNLSQVSFRLFNLSRPDRSQYKEENLSTEVTEEDLANAWTDEFGVKYSVDRKRLLKAPAKIVHYSVKAGTKVICDNAFYNINTTFNEHAWLKYGGNEENYYEEKPASDLESIIIPQSVSNIGNKAFWMCRNLKNIDLQNGLKHIGDMAFSGCSSIKTLDLPKYLEVIGDSSFKDCRCLESIIIPNMVKSIGKSAFYGCERLSSIILSEKLEIIEPSTFGFCEGIKSILIPKNVKSIGGYAFQMCSNLSKVYFPERLMSIGKSAFGNCRNLLSIAIPYFTKEIGEDAFYKCTGLTSITVDERNVYYNSRENCNAIIETKSECLILACKNTIIPNGVSIIGRNAFSLIKDVDSIVLPNTIKDIGYGAFSGCENLSSINIPESLNSVGDTAFYGCKKLLSAILINNKVLSERLSDISDCLTKVSNEDLANAWVDEYGAKYSPDKKRLLWVPRSLTDYSIGKETMILCDYSFMECEDLTTVIIPDGVRIIGFCAFKKCISLPTVSIPNTVIKLGSSSFEGCSRLTGLQLPDSMKTIGKYVFMDCISLSSIALPNHIAIIEKSVFSGCKELSSIEIPDSVTEIKEGAFGGCKKIVSIHIPKNVQEIGNFAFAGCEALSDITISEGITKLGGHLFSGCNSLRSIYIPESITEFNGFDHDGWTLKTFDKCDSLRSIYIPKGTTEKFKKLFPECKDKLVEQDEDENLSTEVTDEDLANAWTDEFGVKYSADRKRLLDAPEELEDYSIKKGTIIICENAFSGDPDFSYYRLRNIYIPNSVQRIGSWAFRDCSSLSSIIIPDSTIEIGYGAFSDCYNLTSIIVDDNNVHYDSRDYCNAVIETSTNTLIKGCKDTVIPDSVKVIGALAFRGSGLTDINIPDSVKEIGIGAFYGCYYLESIVIPSSVKCIEDNTFYGCHSLDEIVIPSNVKSIGEYAFSQCLHLKKIRFSAYISNIDPSAFIGCSELEYIIIPDFTFEEFEKLLPKFREILMEKITIENHKGHRRLFSKKELEVVKRAKVVQGQYTKLVCFYMNDGYQKYIPLCKQSPLSIGDEVDLNKAKLIEFDDEGIYYGLHVDGYDDVQKYLVEA